MYRNATVPSLPTTTDPEALLRHVRLLTETVRHMNLNLIVLTNYAVRLTAQRAHNADTAAPSFTGGDTVDQTVLEGWASDVDDAIAYINASLEAIKVHATS